MQNGYLVVAAKKKNTITGFDQWLEAFNVYEQVVVSANPARFIEFSNYRQIMHRAQKQYIWPAVYTFDNYHRSALATSIQGRLDQIDPALYAQVLNATAVKPNQGCFKCKAPDHQAKHCQFGNEAESRLPSHQPFRGKGRSWSEGGLQGYGHVQTDSDICNNYNRNACYYRQCKRAHVCKVCKGSHPVTHCTRSGNQTRSQRH
jgi:hypothetical protein